MPGMAQPRKWHYTQHWEGARNSLAASAKTQKLTKNSLLNTKKTTPFMMSTERASSAHWKPDTKIARRNGEHQKGQCLSESHQGLIPWKMIKFNPGLS